MVACDPIEICLTVDSDGNYNGFFAADGVLYVIQIYNTNGTPTGYILSIVGSDGTDAAIPNDPSSTCNNIIWPAATIFGSVCMFQIINNALCCASVSSQSQSSQSQSSQSSTSIVTPCNCNLPSVIHLAVANTFNCNGTYAATYNATINAWVATLTNCKVCLQCVGNTWIVFLTFLDGSNPETIAEGPAIASCSPFLIRFDQVRELQNTPCNCGNISGTLTWMP